METQPQQDFRELLALFNGHKVEYLIVGALALAFHGAPRHRDVVGVEGNMHADA